MFRRTGATSRFSGLRSVQCPRLLCCFKLPLVAKLLCRHRSAKDNNSGRGCPCVLGAGRGGNLRLSERRSKLVWFLLSVSRFCKLSSATNEKTAMCGRLSRNVVGSAILLPNRDRCFARLLAHRAWCSAISASRKPLRICRNKSCK